MTSETASRHPALDRPIIIVGSPRSGSTLLFETLSRSPSLVTIGSESHGVIEGIHALHPAAHGWHSNRLTEREVEPQLTALLARRFAAKLPPEGQGRRLLEKTPKNSLRVPFFAHAFPDAVFVFLRRDVRQTLSSMIEAWQSGRFRTYPRMPHWQGLPWSLLLVPGWRDLAGKPLAEVVARQWAITMEILLDDLERLAPERVFALDYDDFIADPDTQCADLAKALGIDWEARPDEPLALSSTTVSRPSAEKWRRHDTAIAGVWPIVENLDLRAAAFAARRAPGQ